MARRSPPAGRQNSAHHKPLPPLSSLSSLSKRPTNTRNDGGVGIKRWRCSAAAPKQRVIIHRARRIAETEKEKACLHDNCLLSGKMTFEATYLPGILSQQCNALKSPTDMRNCRTQNGQFLGWNIWYHARNPWYLNSQSIPILSAPTGPPNCYAHNVVGRGMNELGRHLVKVKRAIFYPVSVSWLSPLHHETSSHSLSLIRRRRRGWWLHLRSLSLPSLSLRWFLRCQYLWQLAKWMTAASASTRDGDGVGWIRAGLRWLDWFIVDVWN